MIPGTPRRRGARAFLIALVGLLTAWPFSAATAAAQGPAVSVTISSLTVEGNRPGDEVVLRARVTNTGDVPAYHVRAVLWRSRDPIRDLPTLRAAADIRTGWGEQLAGKSADLTDGETPLAPNGSREVTLKATLAQLGLVTQQAAYAVGLDVLGSDSPTGAESQLGRLRTFVAVPGSEEVPVTSIVLLSSAPGKLWDGVFVDDHLAEELTGRLDTLLTAAARPGMSWLVDPALVDAVTDMADGYLVTGPDGQQPGTGQEAAKRWLARFNALDAKTGAHTLFANPDVAGAAAARDDEVLARARTATNLVTAVEDLPLLVLPAESNLTTAVQGYLAPANADALLAANTVRAGAWQSGQNGNDVLSLTPALGVTTDELPASRAQTALAEAVIAGRAGQARLLATTQDLQIDTLATAGWTRRRPLADLLASKPSQARAGFVVVKTGKLSQRQFDSLTALERDFAEYGELVPDSTLTSQAASALTRAASSSWIGDAAGFRRFYGAIADTVSQDAVRERVRLDASARFLMSSRTNQFPLTVTNQLTEPIRVRVVVTTDNPQRLQVPPSELVTVAPGQSQTVNVRPEASANGVVTARAHVQTTKGRRVTADTPITIEITELGLVGWVIVLSSGVVLIVATVWRIRQVRRRGGETTPRTATMVDDD